MNGGLKAGQWALMWVLLGGCGFVTGSLDDAEGGTSSTSATGTETLAPETEPTTTQQASGDAGETADGQNDCCEVSPTPGCADIDVQACVCAEDPYCCQQGWDFSCAGKVAALGCGACADDSNGAPGDCCVEHGGAGCDDPDVEACVCATDPFCCSGNWDPSCAVAARICGGCGGSGDGSTGGTPTDDCCVPHLEPGCADPMIADCVCAAGDTFCCEAAWDFQCVAEVEQLGCGDCGFTGGTGGPASCCEEGESPGCIDPTVELCVCAQDSFCCSVLWDLTCTELVEDLGCGLCAMSTSDTGSGSGGVMTSGMTSGAT